VAPGVRQNRSPGVPRNETAQSDDHGSRWATAFANPVHDPGIRVLKQRGISALSPNPARIAKR